MFLLTYLLTYLLGVVSRDRLLWSCPAQPGAGWKLWAWMWLAISGLIVVKLCVYSL